jgi:hypothetical protein
LVAIAECRMKIVRTCACGKEFNTWQFRVDEGRGKFCSKSCMYVYRKRRFGFKRVDKGVNASWFKPGHHNIPTFPPGYRPPNFKEEGFDYSSLHHWVKRHKGRPVKCEHCGGQTNLQWANKSWEYHRDLEDWLSLCAKCHRKYDMAGGRGAVAEKFPERRKSK